MATNRIADMTIEELREFVEAVVEQRAQSARPQPYKQRGHRSMEEVVKSIKKNRWTPPSGAKSSLELLREDRDR